MPSRSTHVKGTVNGSLTITPAAVRERTVRPLSLTLGLSFFIITEFVAPESTKNSILFPSMFNSMVGSVCHGVRSK